MENCPMCNEKLEGNHGILHCISCDMEFYTEWKLPLWKINGIQCIECKQYTSQIVFDQCGYFSICCGNCDRMIDADIKDKAELPKDFFPEELEIKMKEGHQDSSWQQDNV
tara:strand:+ start:982 stop:1311 length:330 start_codon:yes stop_codon:yes gene_type:complete